MMDLEPLFFSEAIIAHYETQWLDDVGDIVEVESGSTKKVRIPRDFSRDEIGDLAQEVVEKCKYIPSTQDKVWEVAMLMSDLYNWVNGEQR